jgi:hypothetical protein
MSDKKTTSRICVDIPVEWSELVKKYNATTTRPLMFSQVCFLAIKREIELIEKELQAKEEDK